MKLKEIIPSERPRERLIKHGAKALSLSELFSIILSTGSKKNSITELSSKIVNFISAEKNKNYSLQDLIEIDGVGIVKATKIIASLEVARRINQDEEKKAKIKSSNDVFKNLKYDYFNLNQEHVIILSLSTSNKIISKDVIFKGSLNQSIIHPREIFKTAISNGACSIVISHNHPSGNIQPSKEDVEITKNLVSIGKTMGIPVLDHVIIAKNNYFSFKDNFLI